MKTLLVLKNNHLMSLFEENITDETVIRTCADEAEQAQYLLDFIQHKHIIGMSHSDKPLPEADIIVAQGRGLTGADGAALLDELAEKLGARVACTRPCIDRGWQPKNRLIGKAGLNVSPKLYLAFGISGSIQHIGGVNAEYLIAINNNPNAFIFRRCDFGICGNAKKILTAFLGKL